MNIDIDSLLKEKKLSKTDVAKRMGLSRESIYRILSGNPTLDNINKLADAIGVEIKDLFRNECDDKLTALIQHGGDFYRADTLTELESIVKKIRSSRSSQKKDL